MPYPRTNKQLDITDLARPLSLEAVVFFASDELPKAKEHDTARFGKFVRLGEAMVIGATMSHGTPDHRGDLSTVFHWQLIRFLHDDPELHQRAEATYNDEPHLRGGLTDAGRTFIKVDETGAPVELSLGGNSFDFGRADAAGREKTLQVAQALVGDTVRVTGELQI